MQLEGKIIVEQIISGKDPNHPRAAFEVLVQADTKKEAIAKSKKVVKDLDIALKILTPSVLWTPDKGKGKWTYLVIKQVGKNKIHFVKVRIDKLPIRNRLVGNTYYEVKVVEPEEYYAEQI